ncbi:helix-turn-helix domain-containing protein [Marinimicrobium agarilyticum]|uniref:helix-turn-helix domain-containing protein n=1 Tax=Marinimicrobium agarilyticum TaxID=306546 RepID=UPI0003F84134|nr:AraC family transcriptional regulator [Marinimicrobium agarilyticum]
MKDYIFNIHDVVLLMTVAESILLALLQAALPAQNRLYGRLLSVFLIVIAVAAVTTLVLWNDQLHTTPTIDHYWIPYFLIVSLMVKGPTLYLYVASITRAHFTLKPLHLLHLIPALVAVIIMATFGIDSNSLRYIWAMGEPQPEQVVTSLWDAAKLVPLVYSFAAVALVQRYRSELKDEYSHFSSTEPRWLNILTLGFFASWAWSTTVHVLAKYSSPETADYLGIADNYFTFILINALFTYSLVYAHQLLTTRSDDTRAPAEEKPSDSAIDRVRDAMENDKIYLQQNLNIEQFGARLKLPVKEVSSVINKHFGTNFFEFINSYRVEEAKRLLADPTLTEKTILDILLESGFNSKSAFHRFFKRLVGESPSEYRKRMNHKAE